MTGPSFCNNISHHSPPRDAERKLNGKHLCWRIWGIRGFLCDGMKEKKKKSKKKKKKKKKKKRRKKKRKR